MGFAETRNHETEYLGGRRARYRMSALDQSWRIVLPQHLAVDMHDLPAISGTRRDRERDAQALSAMQCQGAAVVVLGRVYQV